MRGCRTGDDERAGGVNVARVAAAKTYSPLTDVAIRPCDVLLAAFAVNPEFRLQSNGRIYCRLRTNK